MSRPPRLDPPLGWHHVFNRRPAGRALFRSDDDRRAFLDLLAPLDARFGVEVHAYALMDSHFHLLVRSRRGGLARAMRDLQHRWSLELTRRYREVGPAFQSRYGSRLIEDERYLAVVVAYIHLNPVVGGLAASPDRATWTSHPAYRGLAPRPPWLHTEALLEHFGDAETLHDAVLSRADLPPELLAETFAPILHTQGPLAPPVRQSPEDAPEADVSELLASVEAITGQPAGRLGAPQVGARPNANLHLAIYALSQRTALTQRQIGALLGLTPRQVAWVVQVQRRGMPQEIRDLVARWEEQMARS